MEDVVMTSDEPDVECTVCHARFYSADTISDDSPICPNHRRRRTRRTPRGPISGRERAIAALRAELAEYRAERYPADNAPRTLASDLLDDEKRIREWFDGQPFGWVIHMTGTLLIRAGARLRCGAHDPLAWVCLTCTKRGAVRRYPNEDPQIPGSCPDCGSERYPNHGPQVACNAGSVAASSFGGCAFYTWDGMTLTPIPGPTTFDESVTTLGSLRLRASTEPG